MRLLDTRIGQFLRRAMRDESGAGALIAGIVGTGLVGMAGLSIDVGQTLVAKKRLSAAVQADAMVGAQALTAANATTTSVTTAVNNWIAQNPVKGVTVTNTTSSLLCVTSTSNLPNCNGTSPNAVKVTQSGKVSTYFLKAFGYTSFTINASATAAAGGGAAAPLQVMFILDSTASMNTTDTGCTVPGISRPTRFQCADYSIQQVLKQLQPSLTKVALMTYPGTASVYTPNKPCPTQPTPIPYLSNTIYYQIGTGFDSNYNNGAGVLNTSSMIVRAVGDISQSLTGCLTAKGGQGTYIAEVIKKAQAALPVVTGTKNVIILLSDGDANASASQLSNKTSYVSKQCGQAVSAAQAATAAGITVYSVAYGAAQSGCSSGDTYNPCTAMQAIASDKTKFYSTSSTCQFAGSPNNAADLPSVFKQIAGTLSKPRLLLN